jgi:4-hydroxythreonine-4-phosphate dehydrogenase
MSRRVESIREWPEHLPIVAITMGDPCGVGPEIIVKAFDSPRFAGDCVPVVVGDRFPLEREIASLGSSIVVRPIADEILKSARSTAFRAQTGVIPLLALVDRNGRPAKGLRAQDTEFGKPSPAACDTAVSCIRTAVGLVCSGLADAVCTSPINKEQLHRNGFPFPGHTEFIRELTGAEDVVMMLAGPRLRVALATIHVSLADVPRLLTEGLLRKVVRITAESMVRDFAIKSPRIAVAGLNPHAGEAGKFGREEIEVIRPVIEAFKAAAPEPGGRRSGFYPEISGPWPPDTVFHRAFSGEFDAVVAMYHDQGLIAVKLAHFSEAVNVSLGLPIVRTSVDHGTAYDIAGTGAADPRSLMEAVSLAASIARNRKTLNEPASGVYSD